MHDSGPSRRATFGHSQNITTTRLLDTALPWSVKYIACVPFVKIQIAYWHYKRNDTQQTHIVHAARWVIYIPGSIFLTELHFLCSPHTTNTKNRIPSRPELYIFMPTTPARILYYRLVGCSHLSAAGIAHCRLLAAGSGYCIIYKHWSYYYHTRTMTSMQARPVLPAAPTTCHWKYPGDVGCLAIPSWVVVQIKVAWVWS